MILNSNDIEADIASPDLNFTNAFPNLRYGFVAFMTYTLYMNTDVQSHLTDVRTQSQYFTNPPIYQHTLKKKELKSNTKRNCEPVKESNLPNVEPIQVI